MTELQKTEAKISALKEKLDQVKGKQCSVFTRITGYYRPYHAFNAGKAAEYKARIKFDLNKSKG